MRDAFVAALTGAAEDDPRIILLTGDLGFGVLDKFAARLPQQYVNVGVAEQNMTALAAGLALEGRIVFTYSIANFTTLRCLEQIRNDVCYHGLNVNIVSVGGGFSYGSLGPTHHATEDLAIMRALPGMTVFAPNDDAEVEAGLAQLLTRPGPSYIRLDRASVPSLASLESAPIVIGRVRLIGDFGKRLTLVATGGMAVEAIRAASLLAADGIGVRVLSLHTLTPLDRSSLLGAALESGGIVTIEEHSLTGGLGSAVAECLLDVGVIPNRFLRIALPAAFTSIVGSQSYLRDHYRISAEHIARRVRALVSGRRAPAVEVDAT